MKTHNTFFLIDLKTAWILCSLVMFSLMQFGCTAASDASRDADGEVLIPAVEAVKSRYGALPLTERLTGAVKAKNQIEIYPEISAVITKVYVQNGEQIKRGQPLVQLRDRDFTERFKQARASYQITVAQARQAEAELKEARADLQRIKSLADQNLASDAQLENMETQAVSAEAAMELAKARVDQAQASLDERKEDLTQTIIRAPISGSVGNRNAEIGMLVSTNQRLFTLGQLDSVRVEIILTDRMLNYIETGQRTEILTEKAGAGQINAPIKRISPFLHPITHSTVAEIDLANPDRELKSGQFVAVDVFYGESENATLIPLSALYENPITGGTGVYISTEDFGGEQISGSLSGGNGLTAPKQFEFVPVEVIARGRMEAGVRGIEQDSWVVTIGQDLLSGASGKARVRPVEWNWVNHLQQLQRQDILDELMTKDPKSLADSTNASH